MAYDPYMSSNGQRRVVSKALPPAAPALTRTPQTYHTPRMFNDDNDQGNYQGNDNGRTSVTLDRTPKPNTALNVAGGSGSPWGNAAETDRAKEMQGAAANYIPPKVAAPQPGGVYKMNQDNPYNTDSEAFRGMLTRSREGVINNMGGAEQQARAGLSSRGMMGGGMEAAMMGNVAGARAVAMGQAENDLYRDSWNKAGQWEQEDRRIKMDEAYNPYRVALARTQVDNSQLANDYTRATQPNAIRDFNDDSFVRHVTVGDRVETSANTASNTKATLDRGRVDSEIAKSFGWSAAQADLSKQLATTPGATQAQIQNDPNIPQGAKAGAIAQLNNIDQERMTGAINEAGAQNRRLAVIGTLTAIGGLIGSVIPGAGTLAGAAAGAAVGGAISK